MLHDILGDRYVPSDLLSGGGMAKVFRAHDRILGRDAALKVLHFWFSWAAFRPGTRVYEP